MTTADAAQHTLAPLFVRRIEYLNEIIPETLVGSRLWLGALEVLNLLWLVLLVVALGGMNEARGTELMARGAYGWAAIDAWLDRSGDQKWKAVPI